MRWKLQSHIGLWLTVVTGALFCGDGIAAAAVIKLARHPDYYQGKIVFSYLGDLWVVQDDGQNPRRLTVHSARDVYPRFSPDGRWIAFSSDRYGNYDVFVMPADGGTAKRLSYHSSPDTVVGWSPDSKRIVFASARGRLFPGISNLYEIPVEGGLEEPMPTDWGWWGAYSPNGKQLAFNRHPMVWSRKHYRGSYAADLWVMDVESKTYQKILDGDLQDESKPNNFWPMFGNGEIYFVSDREVMAKSGSAGVLHSKNNIWKIPATGGKPVQVTHHESGSLFWPSLSHDGRTIVYEENFGLWKLDTATGQTKEIKIDIISDDKENNHETLTVNGEADSFHLSPSGRRAVISTHGELFTIATERGEVRRLSQTSSVRESQPQWSPDGKWIAFISDQTGREEVWLCNESGSQPKQISDSDALKGQLTWSPDSQALLYSGSDKKLHRYNIASAKTVELATGEVIGFGGAAIANPRWSPDGKWISFTRMSNTLLPHVYIISADGGKEQRLTDSDSYSETSAIWTPDGKRILMLTGVDTGNIGQSGRSTAQITSVSLMPEEKDPQDKSIDNEEEAAKAAREARRPGPGQPRPDGPDGPGAKVEVKINFENIGRRTRQLTRTADTITSLAISPDSQTIAFVTTGTEGGRSVQSIWSLQIDGDRLTRVTQTGMNVDEDAPAAGPTPSGFSSLQFGPEGRALFYRQGNAIYAMTLAPATPTGAGSAPAAARSAAAASASAASSSTAAPRRVDFTARVEIDHRAEHKQVFEESWRIMKHRFYDPSMHGIDWNKMKSVYEPLLAHAGDTEEVHNIISQMIGELNASHTGISGGSRRGSTAAQTRFPGFEMEADSNGFYKVTHIYHKGPADKDYVKIKTGDYVLAIDGQPLKSGDNYWIHFTLAPGNKLEFTINSKPSTEGSWTTKITPVSSTQFATLQYEKWVADRRAKTDQLSAGDIGYLHIRQMNDASLRKFERDLAEMHLKKALIIDQRFNPGGGIDQELLQILQQRQYQYTKVRDSVTVTRPLRGFFGPMVVMENERSTSDAEVFPDGFRTLKLGKVVGVTTYGAVIGTGSYTLMDGSALRTPSSGLWNVNGTNLENNGVVPDVYVDNTPEDFLRGRDAQLEKAIEVLRAELKNQKQSSVR